jgi:ABC-type glycerol-3-phosphate transport system substrate-binding protein
MKKNLLVGLLMLLLCAFSWSTGIQDITAADADWKKGVTELVWFNGGTLSGDPAIAEGLLGWEKTTGIKVKVVEIPGEVYAEQLVRTLALKESTYDVVDASYMLPEWAKNGWILQMDDVISDSLKKQWDPAFLDYISWNGKMYAVPHYNQASFIAVRTDLLKEIGMAEPPALWDDFLKAAQKLTLDSNGDGNPERFGFVFPATGEEAPWLFKDFILSSGTPFWNADGTAAFNNANGEAAVKLLVDMRNKYKVVPPGVVNYKLGDCGDIFNGGQAAMAYLSMGGLVYNALKSPIGKDFTMAPVPTRIPVNQIKGPAQHAYAMVTVVPVNCRHPEAAKRLALWMGSYQQSWNEAVVEGNVPVHMGVFESPYLKTHYAFSEQIETILKRSVVLYRYLEEIDIVRKGLQFALTEEMTPVKALEYIANDLNKIKK